MIAGIYAKGLLLSRFLYARSDYGDIEGRPPNSLGWRWRGWQAKTVG